MVIETNFNEIGELIIDMKVLSKAYTTLTLEEEENSPSLLSIEQKTTKGYSKDSDLVWKGRENERVISFDELGGVKEGLSTKTEEDVTDDFDKDEEDYEDESLEDEEDYEDEEEYEDEESFEEDEEFVEEDDKEDLYYEDEEEYEELDLNKEKKTSNNALVSKEETKKEEIILTETLTHNNHTNNIQNREMNEEVFKRKEANKPTNLIEFVRKNRYCDIKVALQYFTLKEIDLAINTGRLYKTKNKLYL